MGIRDLFGGGEEKLSGSERREFREHLADLDAVLEEGLESLGEQIAHDLSQGNSPDTEAIWREAGRLDAVEREIQLVERGITERLTREQLAEIAAQEAGGREA